MLDLESMDVNYGIQTFDSSIRCRDGDLRIAWYFCDASAARRENDRFLSLPVWRNCDGSLLSLVGTFPPDSEAGFLAGVRHGISDAWQLRIGVSLATIVYQVQPFIVLVAGAILFQERLGLTKILLFLAALLGLVLATGIKLKMIDPGFLLGVGLTLLGATLYAGVVLVGKGLKSVKPEIVIFIQCAEGVLIVPIVDPSILHTSIELRQWGWLSGLGVIHTALVYALIYHALPKLKSSAIAILTFIYPASAIFFDFVVYGRLVSPVQFLGLVIIALSSFGITQGWKLPKISAARVKLCGW
jgi:drug/metabolite transporter (DMT)-like permease